MDPHHLLGHRDFVRSIACSLLPSAHDAADLEQEAWLTAIERPPRQALAFRSWITRCARNLRVQRQRSESSRQHHEARVQSPARVPPPEEVLEREERRRQVVRAVLALPEEARAVVLLRHYEDRSLPEIARLLEIPLETARTRLRRAHRRLRERLERSGPGRTEWNVALALLAGRREPIAVASLSGSRVGALLGLVALLLGAGFVGVSFFGSGSAAENPNTGWTTASVSDSMLSTDPRILALPTRHADEQTSGAQDSIPAIRGRVLDPGGRPVANASIFVFPEDTQEVLRPAEDTEGTVRATTDAAGCFVVTPPAPQRCLAMFVEATGWSSRLEQPVWPGEELEIRLEPPLRMEGTVVDEDGFAVPDALVHFWIYQGGPLVERFARSDEDGTYTLEGLPAISMRRSQWLVAVTAEGCARLTMRSTRYAIPTRDGFERFGDGVIHQHFVLGPGATLRGTVVDSSDGRPLANAEVSLWSREGDFLFAAARGAALSNPYAPYELGRAFTDAEGHYEIPTIPAEGFHASASSNSLARGVKQLGFLCVEREGYGSVHQRRQQVRIRLPERGEVLRADVRLSAAATLSADGASRGSGPLPAPASAPFGAVVLLCDTEGRPVPGARFTEFQGRPSSGPCPTSDAEGRAEIPQSWSSVDAVTVESAGHATAFLPLPALDAQRPPVVELTLQPEHRLRGRVLDQNGEGLVGYGVVASALDAARPAVAAGTFAASRPPGRAPTLAATRTRSNGHFELRGLPDGPYEVTVSTTFGSQRHSLQVEDADGEVLFSFRVPTLSHLRGELWNADTGKRIARHDDLRGTLTNQTGQTLYVLRSRPGCYAVPDVPPGRWTLQLGLPGYETSSEVIEVDEEGLVHDVALRPAGRLGGRILGLDPASIEGLTIAFSCEGTPGATQARIDGDRYEADGLGPGTYRAFVEGTVLMAPPEGAVFRGAPPVVLASDATITVLAGEEAGTKLDLDLAAGGTLTVFLDPGSTRVSRPAEGWTFAIEDDRGHEVAPRLSMSAGAHHPTTLRVGSYSVFVQPGPGEPLLRFPATVSLGARSLVTVPYTE